MGKTTKNYNDHTLVPKHEKISEKQKQELLKEYNCTETELPRIKRTDAAISDAVVKPGDIIKVSRKSVTEGVSTFYRVVTDE